MDIDDTLYPGGIGPILQRLDRRSAPFLDAVSEVPPLDTDLQALHLKRVAVPPSPEAGFTGGGRRDASRKWHAICEEFDGQSELFARHALMIAFLRRRSPPAEAVALFLRMWRDMGETLAQELPIRWLISAAATFADHGATLEQRQGGLGFYMLFDLIKLHDSERRVSGRPNDHGFVWKRSKEMHDLAFDMQPYSLRQGDLDLNMIGRLWDYADADPVFQPLGMRMLELLLADKRSVFGRIQRYKWRPQGDDSTDS